MFLALFYGACQNLFLFYYCILLACFFILFLAIKCTINMVIFIPKRPPLYSAYFTYALADLDNFMCQVVEYSELILSQILQFLWALPSADSRRAVVSFWRKNVHNTG